MPKHAKLQLELPAFCCHKGGTLNRAWQVKLP